MFYIDTNALIRKREVFLLHILPTLVVFTAFMGVTVISWSSTNTNAKEEQFSALQQRNTEATTHIKQRIDSYEDILRGSAGLFRGSDNVTREEWRSYLTSYNVAARYPGVQGIGYVQIIPPADLTAQIETIRSQGYPDYTVFPTGERSIYTSVIYIEPFNGDNLKAFGYDMYAEPTRHEAMDKARDSGDIAISDIVKLIQDKEGVNTQPGFLMYMPLYKKDSNLGTLADRRANLTGYIYAPFRTYDLISKTIPLQNDPYGFEMYNVTNQQKQLIYKSSNFDSVNADSAKQLLSTEFTISGTTWQIIGAANPAIVRGSTRDRQSSTFWGGFLFSFFVAGFIYLLLANRANALASKEEYGIQAAKDELLALASHQLRTPATGVKQYVGMLREGFAGKVSAMQQRLLDKAYESNERQLATINQMLFVARADAGELKMERVKINLNALVKDIVDEQAETIKEREQKIIIKLPKQPIYVRGDRQYLRMAFENIISNGSKYTKLTGKISVTVRTHGQRVLFRVTDSGVGVAKEDLLLLFKKFSRIPNELTNQVSGSGIGLYLARKVVDAHGGEIDFISTPNKGSTVTISLPKIATKKPRQQLTQK